MLREPKKVEPSVQVRRDNASGRFQLLKLEERIAPRPKSCDGTDPGQSCSKHGKGGIAS